MNFVFLSPNFPSNFYLFCLNLKKAGFNVLGIGDAEFSGLRPELRDSLAWYYKVGNMHNYAELAGACGFFTRHFGKLDRIDSLNEYWLETEAGLRTDFGVSGIKTDSVLDIRRKSRMKKIFSGAGIPFAKGRLAAGIREAREFAAEAGFPVIVKPDDGIGAAYTYKFNSHEELDRFFSGKPDREFIVEEYMEGDIVTFDGLADRNGNIIFSTSHVYGQGVMEAVLSDSHVFYYSVREIPEDLERAGRKLVKGFDVRERFFHFEFFRRKDGTLAAMEVNIRPPGGMTVDMFNYSCDIDLYEVWARVMAEGTCRLDYARKYHSCYVSRKYRNNYLHSHGEVMERLGPMIVHHEELPPVLSRAMGDYGYIVRSGNLGEILGAVSFIQGLR